MKFNKYFKEGFISLLSIFLLICLFYTIYHQVDKATSDSNNSRTLRWNVESEYFRNGTLPKVKPSEIAILMAFDNHQSYYLPRSVEDKEDYAKLHGYKFLQDGVHDSGKPAVWGKIASLRKFMRQYPKIKWFWWIDLDTIILDPYYALEDHILGGTRHPRFANKDVIMSYDCNGFNAGSFMIRNSEWSIDFLKRLYSPAFHNRFGYQEQGAMQHLFESDTAVAEHFYIIPQRRFNAFPPGACYGLEEHCFQEGDFLVHFAGCWVQGQENCQKLFDEYWNRKVKIIWEEL
ncbi:hypothetical protein K7432_004776 [Basidiobolus ranarum]|uniref:Uncharacterized protein n=1 Tax=Basidiobolus ranarum TaxID=34480 RepID=A0ABR2W4M3_9FUNG